MTDTKIKHLNQPGDYYFCSLCGKWHTDVRKDHLQYRLHIQRDHKYENGAGFIKINYDKYNEKKIWRI